MKKLIQKILKKLKIELFRVYFYERDLHKEVQTVKADVELDIRPTCQQDLEILLNITEEPFKSRLKNYNLDKFHGLIAWHNNKIAGYTWFRDDYLYILKYKIKKLPPNSVMGFDSYVFPEYRGKKVFSQIISEAYGFLKNKGYHKTYGFISLDNTASIKGREKFQMNKKKLDIIIFPTGHKIILGGKIF